MQGRPVVGGGNKNEEILNLKNEEPDMGLRTKNLESTVPSCSKIATEARLESVLGDSTWRNMDWESRRRERSPANRLATWKENDK